MGAAVRPRLPDATQRRRAISHALPEPARKAQPRNVPQSERLCHRLLEDTDRASRSSDGHACEFTAELQLDRRLDIVIVAEFRLRPAAASLSRPWAVLAASPLLALAIRVRAATEPGSSAQRVSEKSNNRATIETLTRLPARSSREPGLALCPPGGVRIGSTGVPRDREQSQHAREDHGEQILFEDTGLLLLVAVSVRHQALQRVRTSNKRGGPAGFCLSSSDRAASSHHAGRRQML